MAADKFYNQYRTFLNLFEADTTIRRSTGGVLLLRMSDALYDNKKDDETFRHFRENRKAMRETDLSDPALDEKDDIRRETVTWNQDLSSLSNGPERLQSLSTEKLREIMAITFSGWTQLNQPPQRNPVVYVVVKQPDTGSKGEQKFGLEIALGR